MKHYCLDLTLIGIEHREYSMFSLSEGTRLFHTIIDNLKGDGDIYYLKGGELYYEDDVCTVGLLCIDAEVNMNDFKWFVDGHNHVYFENQKVVL